MEDPNLWSVGDVLEFVEHPIRRMRCGDPDSEDLAVFKKVNRLGELLNKFSSGEQEELVSNFIDTLEQHHDNLSAGD